MLTCLERKAVAVVSEYSYQTLSVEGWGGRDAYSGEEEELYSRSSSS